LIRSRIGWSFGNCWRVERIGNMLNFYSALHMLPRINSGAATQASRRLDEAPVRVTSLPSA